MRNRKLVIPGVYLADVTDALRERGIPATEVHILAYAQHVQLIASAYAKAVLQDATAEDIQEAFELFAGSTDQMLRNPLVAPGTYLGDSMRHIPTTFKEDTSCSLPSE